MNVLFVCSGNTCRSPLALAAWRSLRAAELKRERDADPEGKTSQSGARKRPESSQHSQLESPQLESPQLESPQLESPQLESPQSEFPQGRSARARLPQSRLPGAWLLERDAASAGLAAQEGARAARHAIEASRAWNQDLSLHGARRLNRVLTREAALICTMTMEQALAVCAHFGASVERVRPLGEFAAWCDDSRAGLRALEDERLASLLGHAPRTHDYDDDIPDPYGGSLEAYRCCAEQIHRAVAGLRVALRRGEAHLR